MNKIIFVLSFIGLVFASAWFYLRRKPFPFRRLVAWESDLKIYAEFFSAEIVFGDEMPKSFRDEVESRFQQGKVFLETFELFLSQVNILISQKSYFRAYRLLRGFSLSSLEEVYDDLTEKIPQSYRERLFKGWYLWAKVMISTDLDPKDLDWAMQFFGKDITEPFSRSEYADLNSIAVKQTHGYLGLDQLQGMAIHVYDKLFACYQELEGDLDYAVPWSEVTDGLHSCSIQLKKKVHKAESEVSVFLGILNIFEEVLSIYHQVRFDRAQHNFSSEKGRMGEAGEKILFYSEKAITYCPW